MTSHHRPRESTALGRIPDLLDALPKDGAWVPISEIALALRLDARFVGRIANLATKSTISTVCPLTHARSLRLHPDLCRTWEPHGPR